MADTDLDLVRGTLDLLILKTLTLGPDARPRRDALDRADHPTRAPDRGRRTLSRPPSNGRKGMARRRMGLHRRNRKAKFYRLTAPGESSSRPSSRGGPGTLVCVGLVIAARRPWSADMRRVFRLPGTKRRAERRARRRAALPHRRTHRRADGARRPLARRG